MKKIVALVALFAGVALAPAPAHAAAAHDDDHQPCVSRSEFNLATRGSMRQEEVAWEVVGLGHVVQSKEHGQHVVKQYPYCGAPQSQAFIQVSYDRNRAGRYMAYCISRWVY